MKQKKQYTWMPENCDRFDECYDSIEEAIADAQARFDGRSDEYADYEEDAEYNENSPVIQLAEVEHFNVRKAVESIVNGIEELLDESLDNFNYCLDCDSKAEVVNEAEFKEQAVNALLPLVEKYFRFSPSMKSWAFKDMYDLRTKQYINDEQQ